MTLRSERKAAVALRNIEGLMRYVDFEALLSVPNNDPIRTLIHWHHEDYRVLGRLFGLRRIIEKPTAIYFVWSEE